ncbi:hypothetical protein SAMN06309944_1482 [Micrococcales bacterium KH10]|nr:hypothetical protein SAMN06309944_1482 [Micrococcales bacterium KH10]
MAFVDYRRFPDHMQWRFNAMRMELPATGGLVDLTDRGGLYDEDRDALFYQTFWIGIHDSTEPSKWALVWAGDVVELTGDYHSTVVGPEWHKQLDCSFVIESVTPADSMMLRRPQCYQVMRDAFHAEVQGYSSVRSVRFEGAFGKLLEENR